MGDVIEMRRPASMTVGDLRKALRGVPGDLEVVVRAWNDEGVNVCAGVQHAEVEHAHDDADTPFFAIDASEEDETNEP